MILIITNSDNTKTTLNVSSFLIQTPKRKFKVSETDDSVVLENLPSPHVKESRKPLLISKQAYKVEIL